MKSKNIIQSKYKNVTCPKCNFNKIKKDGLRKTQVRKVGKEKSIAYIIDKTTGAEIIEGDIVE